MQPFIERAPIGSRPRAEANEFAANLLNMVIKEGAGPRPRSEGGGGARCGRAAVVQLVVVVMPLAVLSLAVLLVVVLPVAALPFFAPESRGMWGRAGRLFGSGGRVIHEVLCSTF